MEQATYLKINPADSVVVCLQPKKKGEIIEVDGLSIALNQDTPAGHKVLTRTSRKVRISSNTDIPSVMHART